MYEQFLHKPTDDKRSMNEIILSQRLTSTLTQLNLKRINKNSLQNTTILSSTPDSISKISKSEIMGEKALFICISGSPSFPKEFQNFHFPGSVIKFVLPGFQLGLNEQERKERAHKSDLNLFSKQINIKINQFSSECDLVFLYHSYGTFIASFYFKNFYEQQKHRIKGIIELGAGPIRVYKSMEMGVKPSLHMTKQFIEENVDFLFEKFQEQFAKTDKKIFQMSSYASKYHIMSLFMSYKTERFNELFEFNRKTPKVLKLLVYGEKDYIFDKYNNDEKAIFYLYNPEAQLNKEYAEQMSHKYSQIHNQSVRNIQQKFVFKMKQGKHSLHMQKQLGPLIQNMIDDYLQVIF